MTADAMQGGRPDRAPRRLVPAPVLGQAGWALSLVLAVLAGRAVREPSSELALVLPAAGVGALWLLATPGRRPRALVVAAILVLAAVAHHLTGLDRLPSLGFGLAHAVQAAVTVAVLHALGWRRARPPASLLDVAGLLGASIAGAVAGAAAGGLLVATLLDAHPLLSMALLLAPVAVGTFVVVAALPFAPRALEPGGAAGPAERVALVVVTVVVTYVVSRLEWPTGFLFIGLTVLVATRCGPALTSAVVVAQAVVVVVETVLGHGPYVPTAGVTERGLAAQALVAIVALVGLSLALAQERLAAAIAHSRLDQERLRARVDAALIASAGVAVGRRGTTVISANESMAQLCGHPRDDLVGVDPSEWFVADDAQLLGLALRELASGEVTAWRQRLRLDERHGGAWVDVSVSAVAVRDLDGEIVTEVNLQALDVTESKNLEQQLELLALHDDLTGLPNRALLRDRLEMALAEAARDDDLVGVLFVDGDRFKDINDSYGHEAGDLVLREIARRLSGALRAHDTVARLGGDEFVVICQGIGGARALGVVAQRILSRLEQPVRVGDAEIAVGVSVGAVTARGGDDAREILKLADAAMYRAKEGGRGRAVIGPGTEPRAPEARTETTSCVADPVLPTL